jgi:hypothetical protein
VARGSLGRRCSLAKQSDHKHKEKANATTQIKDKPKTYIQKQTTHKPRCIHRSNLTSKRANEQTSTQTSNKTQDTKSENNFKSNIEGTRHTRANNNDNKKSPNADTNTIRLKCKIVHNDNNDNANTT